MKLNHLVFTFCSITLLLGCETFYTKHFQLDSDAFIPEKCLVNSLNNTEKVHRIKVLDSHRIQFFVPEASATIYRIQQSENRYQYDIQIMSRTNKNLPAPTEELDSIMAKVIEKLEAYCVN